MLWRHAARCIGESCIAGASVASGQPRQRAKRKSESKAEGRTLLFGGEWASSASEALRSGSSAPGVKDIAKVKRDRKPQCTCLWASVLASSSRKSPAAAVAEIRPGGGLPFTSGTSFRCISHMHLRSQAFVALSCRVSIRTKVLEALRSSFSGLSAQCFAFRIFSRPLPTAFLPLGPQ